MEGPKEASPESCGAEAESQALGVPCHDSKLGVRGGCSLGILHLTTHGDLGVPSRPQPAPPPPLSPEAQEVSPEQEAMEGNGLRWPMVPHFALLDR